MTTIKEIAIKKAIQILSSVGAQFKIISSDGVEYGELQAVKAKKARNSFKSLYHDEIKDLPVGGVATITAPTGVSFEGVRSAAQSYAIGKWGPGSTISARKGQKIEILRVY